MPSVTADGRFLYLLCRYENGAGELDRIDLTSLSRKTLARDVAFFSADAVTDPEKGVVYSVRTGEDAYSFYYVRADGSAVRLMRRAPAQALTGIALDSRREIGYLLAPGALRRDTALYRVRLTRDSVDAVRLMTGDLSDLVYYEETDTALCLKDAAQSGGQLVRAKEAGAETLGDCAALDGRALSVASRDDILFMTDMTEQRTGALEILRSGGTMRIARDVPDGELLAPVACHGFTALYFLAADNENAYTLYYYTEGQSVPLAERVQGLAALYETDLTP